MRGPEKSEDTAKEGSSKREKGRSGEVGEEAETAFLLLEVEVDVEGANVVGRGVEEEEEELNLESEWEWELELELEAGLELRTTT